jgi:hypothetical protein
VEAFYAQIDFPARSEHRFGWFAEKSVGRKRGS